MGVFLDSSVAIRSERLGHTETQMLDDVFRVTGDQDVGISAIVMTELLHGIYRAKSDPVRQQRQEFIDQLIHDVPVFPYTHEIARLAARIGGEQAALANTILSPTC